MSATCPDGQNQDAERTAFGQCLDLLRTPRVRVHAPPPARTPTRPDPTHAQPVEGSGLLLQFDRLNTNSPDPVTSTVQREVWHHLTAGLAVLSENDHGRDWPLPVRPRLRALLAEFPDDLCIAAAMEAREIVQSQDRAPNITSLFEKKLRDRAGVRLAARASLEFARSQEGPVAA